MTAIIILNWNGWHDTIECIKSIKDSDDDNYFIIIVDNGSENDSVSQLSSYISKEYSSYYFYKENDVLNLSVPSRTVILYSLSQNYGFAKGNNKAIYFIKDLNCDYYLLLNNDTIVERHFLNKLLSFKKKNPQYMALTPRIHYYDEKEYIWNCGGSLSFGFRQYYYQNALFKDVCNNSFLNISFITGCALFFSKELLDNNRIFTERFFFGEEDFEFSIRMKRKDISMACVLDSIIYHKVGRSINKQNILFRSFIYYSNRIIDVKSHYNFLFFTIWLILYIPYIFMTLKKENNDTIVIIKFLVKLLKFICKNNEVNKKNFILLQSTFK